MRSLACVIRNARRPARPVRGRRMTLHKFLTALRRRKWWVAAILLLSLAGAGVSSMMAERMYTATAGVYFSVRSVNGVDGLSSSATFSRDQLATYTTLATTPQVLDPVAERLGISGGAQQLAGQLRVTALDGTVVLDIAATDPNPVRSARIANAVAAELITVVEDLSPSFTTTNQSAVEATVVAPATSPTSPSSPKVSLNLAAGVVLGLGLGILVALGREALDTRVRGAEDVADLTRLPVLGSLATEPGRRRGVLMEAAPRSPQAEAYRQLRTNLQFLDVGDRRDGTEGRHRVLAVSSSLAAEGKSTAAVNLAVALAETSARVLLVDADLRRPSLATVLGLEGAAGLTTVLLDRAEPDDIVQDWGTAGLHVLTSGPLPPNPSELLGSPRMRHLIAELRTDYDYVVLDSAPLLPVTDSAVLAGLVDGVLLLANVTRVRRHQLAESLRNLERVDAPVLGVVLNQVARNEGSYGYTADEDAVQPAGADTPPAARAVVPVPARLGR